MVRILIQKGWPPAWRSLASSAALIGPLMLIAISASQAEAQTGEVRCTVTENGAAAKGSVVVEQDGRRVGSSSCGAALSVPAGPATATVRLDGALDNPSQTKSIQVVAGKTTPVAVDFATGALEVRIEAKSGRGTGLVTVNRGSKRIGTLGSGVAARLSAGTYEVVVRLGGQERRYSVDLRAGQHRTVRAQF